MYGQGPVEALSLEMVRNAQADNCSAWPSNPTHQEDGGGGGGGVRVSIQRPKTGSLG